MPFAPDDAIGMRQQKSAFLKMQIDGSEKLSEAEMSALKSDVKVGCRLLIDCETERVV